MVVFYHVQACGVIFTVETRLWDSWIVCDIGFRQQPWKEERGAPVSQLCLVVDGEIFVANMFALRQ